LTLSGYVSGLSLLFIVINPEYIFETNRQRTQDSYPPRFQFAEPIQVSWINGNQMIPLGNMTLHGLKSSRSRKRATINDSTVFEISDQGAFGQFSQHLITQQNFTWRLQGNNLRVTAVSFPVAKGIKFNKDIIDHLLFVQDWACAHGVLQGSITLTAMSFSETCSCLVISLQPCYARHLLFGSLDKLGQWLIFSHAYHFHFDLGLF
jgi:hypothetical protein